MAADVPKLRLLGTSIFSTPVTGGHLACNPAIDLTATVGEANTTLHVWRPNDQLVSKHAERGKKVEGIRWKEDGAYILFLFESTFSISLPRFLSLPINIEGWNNVANAGNRTIPRSWVERRRG